MRFRVPFVFPSGRACVGDSSAPVKIEGFAFIGVAGIFPLCARDNAPTRCVRPRLVENP